MSTIPNKPASEMTLREHYAVEAMKCRLTNEDMYKRHGCQYHAVADDSVRWADALIDRLNGKMPEAEITPAEERAN
ncbi:MAG: hypothetical protein OEW15_11510 [Nitrospirota bacterium]|nr:hypothetical protein [Nitrospirota bacterium]